MAEKNQMTKMLNTKLKNELRTPSEINLPLKNTAKTREFLHKWANLEYGQPKGFSSADNGAIHVALMAWFKGAENSKGTIHILRHHIFGIFGPPSPLH